MKAHTPLFPLGRIVATPGALDPLARANQSPNDFLNRHVMSDWAPGLPEEGEFLYADASLRFRQNGIILTGYSGT